jgi:serine/threonine protein kinase
MEAPWRDAVLAGGKYALVEEIGRGGMGSVWRAHAVLLDRPCAIKFLKPELAAQAVNRERFVHEARAAARLRSNHVVTIFDVDYFNGLPFIAMELLTGESLERRLDRGTLSPEFTLQVIRQIASGLGRAHQAGLVHRDLKPDNVFLVEEDPLLVKLLDFGVAKSLNTLAMHRSIRRDRGHSVLHESRTSIGKAGGPAQRPVGPRRTHVSLSDRHASVRRRALARGAAEDRTEQTASPESCSPWRASGGRHVVEGHDAPRTRGAA